MDQDAYYRMVEVWNEKFWTRLGGPPPLEGKRCLDLGCGVGALSINLVRRGAGEVVGVDPDAKRIAYAEGKRAELPAELAERVGFRSVRLAELVGGEPFDLIVSRDAFEHIHDLPEVVDELVSLLKPGGLLYVGFGPLYNSPLGDHRLMGFGLPWFHLLLDKLRLGPWLLPDRWALVERELNRMSYKAIRGTLYGSGLEISHFEVNAGTSLPLRVFRALRRLPLMRELCSVNIYAILQKPAAPGA